LAGFGYSTVPEGHEFTRENWLEQLVAFMDAHGVEKAHVIGNSFGGSMALALAIAHLECVDRLVLMGSVGVPFAIIDGLDAVWGDEPSLENMGKITRIFSDDQALVGDDLVRVRYEASARTGAHASYSAMFPAPRWVEEMAHNEAGVRTILHKTLLVHGRDDKVIPLQTSLTTNQWISDSQLHIYGRCGHWTQIEYAAPFSKLVANFLTGPS
jgi:2-hydroxymuconate-semialdehyde hydrolase